jgi:3-hydroxyacyl-CoA dehydrogenase
MVSENNELESAVAHPDTSLQSTDLLPHADQHIALIGLGAIGVSFLALHLQYTAAIVSVYDPRPDLKEHVASVLPLYLSVPQSTSSESTDQDKDDRNKQSIVNSYIDSGRLHFSSSLREAVQQATIIQEQGPENLSFKQSTWAEVLQHVSPTCHLWSSTSGIPASQQLEQLVSSNINDHSGLSETMIQSARKRLLVVHPFNPPHIMPLLELVPSPSTAQSALHFARSYFKSASPIHTPIPINLETKGFIANRLSFILFREAISLVSQGVCTVEELDDVMKSSLGVRWAVGGVFEMYNFGGGKKGMEGFLENIGGALNEVWRDVDGAGEDKGRVMMDGEGSDEWKEKVVRQTREVYGVPGEAEIRWRDESLRKVVALSEELKQARPKRGIN